MRVRLNSTPIGSVDLFIEVDSGGAGAANPYTVTQLDDEELVISMSHRRGADALHWCVDKKELLKQWFYERVIRLNGLQFTSLDSMVEYDMSDFSMFRASERLILSLNQIGPSAISDKMITVLGSNDNGLTEGVAGAISVVRQIHSKTSSVFRGPGGSQGYSSLHTRMLQAALPSAVLYFEYPRLGEFYNHGRCWRGTEFTKKGESANMMWPVPYAMPTIGLEAGTWTCVLGLLVELKPEYAFVPSESYMSIVEYGRSSMRCYPVLSVNDIKNRETLTEEETYRELDRMHQDLIYIVDKASGVRITGADLVNTMTMKTWASLMSGRSRWGIGTRIRCNGGPVIRPLRTDMAATA